MLRIAYTTNGTRIEIKKFDPSVNTGQLFCGEGHPVIPKRGKIVQHHFAHAPGYGKNCSSADGKTSWHLWWQERIIPQQLEFRINHEVLKIADAVNIQEKKLHVIEFQNSVMSVEEISFREKFYSRRNLLSHLGVLDCDSELFWIFNLDSCDIEIEAIYGDVVCFKWINGTKYMLKAKAMAFFDFGRQDLIQFLAIHKPETQHPLIIGRLVSLEKLDNFLFKDILEPPTEDNRRVMKHRIGLNGSDKYQELNFPICAIDDVRYPEFSKMIKILKSLYFRKSDKNGASKTLSEIISRFATPQNF